MTLSRQLIQRSVSDLEADCSFFEDNSLVVVTTAELMLATTWDDTEEASATGQIVVVSPITLVTTTVWMADEPMEEMAFATAAVLEAAGQFVTVAAQEITVCICIPRDQQSLVHR